MRDFSDIRAGARRLTRRPGVYAILPHEGRLLMTHQLTDDPEIQLPGGGIDPGEPVLHALYREVIEETGWRICAPRRLGAYRRRVYMPDYDLWAEKICHIYIARPVRCISAPSEAGHTALWIAPDIALEALASAGDRDFVARWLRAAI